MEQKIYVQVLSSSKLGPNPTMKFLETFVQQKWFLKTFCCALPPLKKHISLVATLAGKFFGQTHLTSQCLSADI